MAEIKIEKKKPIWPWVLITIIILAAIAYFIYANNDSDDYPDDMPSDDVDDVNMNSDTTNDTIAYEEAMDVQNTMSPLMVYTESIKDPTRIGIDSSYTKTVFYNLSKVVIEKANQNNLQSIQPLEDMKQYSSQIEGMNNSEMPKATWASKEVKKLSTNVAAVLEAIQTKSFPQLQNDITEFKMTTSKLAANSIMEKQQAHLQAFFNKANDILNKMNS